MCLIRVSILSRYLERCIYLFIIIILLLRSGISEAKEKERERERDAWWRCTTKGLQSEYNVSPFLSEKKKIKKMPVSLYSAGDKKRGRKKKGTLMT